MQDVTYYAPTDDNVNTVVESDWVSVPSREQIATRSLHQSSCVDPLTLRALIRTASGKEGGRNTETEVTTRVWHEGLQKPRPFLRFIIIMQW